MNVVLLVLLAMLTIRRGSTGRRILLLVAAIPVGWAWFLSQRRAAAIAFLVGLVLVAVMLLYKNRRAAMWFIPIVSVVGIGYTLAFWNSTGSAGFAAQAIKSVIAPGSLSAKDQSSDLYRQIESFDLWYTIRAGPLLGQGFGNPFLRPVALPDISSFVFWEYMPHNSVLWIWIKTGFFGFVSMLFLIVRAIQYGMRSLLRIKDPNTSIVVFGALAYVSMYMVYAYVDIAWDIRSMVFLAVAIAICADLEPLLAEEATSAPVLVGDRRLAAAWSR
jgi:O-antigen ligase